MDGLTRLRSPSEERKRAPNNVQKRYAINMSKPGDLPELSSPTGAKDMLAGASSMASLRQERRFGDHMKSVDMGKGLSQATLTAHSREGSLRGSLAGPAATSLA